MKRTARLLARRGRAGLALAALALTVSAGCMKGPPVGGSAGSTTGVGQFLLVSVAPDRAVIRSGDRRVAVTPADGACVAEDAIDLEGASAFVLLTDCALTEGAEMGGAGFPGLVTVSLAAAPRGPMADLQAFLETDAGRRQLARGTDAGEVSIRAASQIDGALYIHARNLDDSAMPLLSRDFWRGFLELNDRMAVITVSGFDAHPLPPEALFDEIRRHALALIEGNGGPAADNQLQDVPPPTPDIGTVRVEEPPARGGASEGVPVPGMPLPPRRAGNV
ncbi:MAG: hypothetical protein AAFV86_12790 [Pseudomonadota bacterium]